MATKFLLGDEISAYLEGFSNKARDIRKLASKLGRASDQNANIIQQIISENGLWINIKYSQINLSLTLHYNRRPQFLLPRSDKPDPVI